MKKTLKLLFLAVGCFTLVRQPATAQVPPKIEQSPEIEQLQEGRYGLIENPNRIFPINRDDIDLELWDDDTPILQNNIPERSGPRTSCLEGNQPSDDTGIREARGWIYNGDGTVSMTDQVDMLCPSSFTQ